MSRTARTCTRQVRNVRWEPAAGRLDHFFDDDLVCASVGVHANLLRGIEPFPTDTLKPYDAGTWPGAGGRALPRSTRRLRSARARRWTRRSRMRAGDPRDTYRNLEVHTQYSRQTFKHILAPVWLMSYTYGPKSFQCVQNGVTGAIQGEYPKSPWKIAGLVVLILIVVIIVLSATGGR
ncbi:MAG: hypothetical protein U1F10_14710 [Burkholderiales bacterium]